MTKLGERIRKALPTRNGGLTPWHETVSEETRKELEVIRREWHEGKIKAPKWTLARTISETLKQDGIVNIGAWGVVRWLEQR
jgi:hypothetical protein